MKKFIVISHTHWDREWYLPFSSFRLKLVDLIDRLFVLFEKDSDYIFHLDAQTIVLEDYLEMRPQNEGLLKKYITSGNLRVGPWYLQNDFYLTDAEATVRNLMIGTKLAATFGKCGTVGYAPDQFGNVSQLPQILSEFGISDFIFGRGFRMYETVNGVRRETTLPAEFEWVGADETKCFAIHLKFWYNNAQHIPAEADCARLLLDINERNFEGVNVSPYILLMNGVDHLEAQADVKEIIADLRKDGYEIEQSSLDDYVQMVRRAVHGKKLQSYRGALNRGCDYDVLKGCWSSRIYLKTANVKAQDLLLTKLEPLYSYLRAGGFEPYPENELHYLWKELLKNHPHDSICGCSNDATHRHMEDRFEQIAETGEDLVNRGLKVVAAHMPHPEKHDNNYSVTLFNGTARTQSGVVQAELNFLLKEKITCFDLVDEKGVSIPYEIISRQEALLDIFSPLNLPGVLDVLNTRIAFYAKDVPPFTAKIYAVVPHREGNTVQASGKAEAENEFYVFEIVNGVFGIRDKRTGKTYRNPIRLEDSADKGDAYVYRVSPCAPMLLTPAKAEFVRRGYFESTVKLTFEYDCPVGYDFENDARSAQTVPMRVNVELTLKRGSSMLSADYAFENRACDHRVRILLDGAIKKGRLYTDGVFDYAERLSKESCDITDSDTHHNATFARLSEESNSLTVYTQGQHECEFLQGGLALTVVRCTGEINRDCNTFRPTGGKKWSVPQNQCLRMMEGKFGFEYGESASAADCFEKAKFFRTGFLVHADSFDTRKYSGGRFAVQAAELEKFYYLEDVHFGKTLPCEPFFACESDRLAVTCCKAGEHGGVTVRLVNLSEEEVVAPITFRGSAYRTTMAEDKREFLARHSYMLTVKPKQVVTLQISGAEEEE